MNLNDASVSVSKEAFSVPRGYKDKPGSWAYLTRGVLTREAALQECDLHTRLVTAQCISGSTWIWYEAHEGRHVGFSLQYAYSYERGEYDDIDAEEHLQNRWWGELVSGHCTERIAVIIFHGLVEPHQWLVEVEETRFIDHEGVPRVIPSGWVVRGRLA